MLAVHEAQRAGYDEAILLTHDGYVADGSGENIFVVKDGVIFTPDLSASILPGITRETMIEIARALGYTVHEKALIRGPLHRRRGVHVRHRCRGDTDLLGRRPGHRQARADLARAPAGVLGHRSRPQAAVGRLARLPDTHARAGVTTPHAGTELPLSGAYLDEREELVLEVRSGRLSLGPMIDRFEQLIASRVGAPYAAAVSSGTAGLHLLCRIAGIGPGDEVITSPISFVASANCFIFEGAQPVFADVDPRTLNLDLEAVEAAITDREPRRSSPSTCSGTRASSTSSNARRAARAGADRGRCRGARR